MKMKFPPCCSRFDAPLLIGSIAARLLSVVFALVLPARAGQVDIPAPPDSGDFYAENVVVLPNGNIVVVDTSYSPAGAQNVGAVYLLNGANLSVISKLVGSVEFDSVGDDGITVLSNGNFFVVSPTWNESRGAVTWGSATTGFNGIGGTVVVSASNSVVGSTPDDKVGASVSELSNGDYVVTTPFWDGTAEDVGASTWVNGSSAGARTVGAVSAINSLVGSSASDQVGNGYITELSNGNYVVASPEWNVPGGAVNVGAVTWANGLGGTVGAVSTTNSLIGTTANDQVGGNDVVTLTNGNYVVGSPSWDVPGGAVNVGAATWGNGSTAGPRTLGAVSAANSLIGSNPDDGLNSDITELSNGNYVVSSPNWDGAVADVGAVTWGNGATAGPRTVGAISAAKSLVGSSLGDRVSGISSFFGVAALSNGNYLISTPAWDVPGGAADVGAATWGNGSGGTVGPVSATNSLIGSTAGDRVSDSGGFFSFVSLGNGNYVVSSPNWDGAAVDVGAVTWGNGSTAGPRTVGAVSATNSLVGSTAKDKVGGGGFFSFTPLSNDNFVVRSPDWNILGGAVDVGAVTWCSGLGGTVGAVSASNSLVGSTASDKVGDNFITPLSNGNYVVRSSSWDGAAADVGAVTWGNGSTAGPRTAGAVSSSNSIVGSTTNDRVGGDFVTLLSNGNYVIKCSTWDIPGGAADVGAVTWGNGSTAGLRTVGIVSATNSLIGSKVNDGVGRQITALNNGNYVVDSPTWDSAMADVGAVTWGNGSTAGPRTVGAVSAANSLIGSTINDGVMNDIIALGNGDYLVASEGWDNPSGSIVDARAMTYGNGTNGSTTGPVSAVNSVRGTVTGGIGYIEPVFNEQDFIETATNYDPVRNRVFVGRGSSRILSIFTPSLTSPPSITSPTSTTITTTNATLGGNVTADGGSAITERGVVFAPTAIDSDPNVGGVNVTKLVKSGPTTGIFTMLVTGLTPGTSYSFKAYALNVNGTSHTAVGTFTTSGAVDPMFSPGKLPNIVRQAGGAVTITSVGIASRIYGVQRSINLINWTQIGTPTAAGNGAVTLTDATPPQPRAFYRVIFPAQ